MKHLEKKYLIIFVILLVILAINLYLQLSESNEVELKLLYVVLHNENNIEEMDKSPFKEKVDYFDETVERESFENIQSESKVKFLNVKNLGDSELRYNKRSIYEWREKLNEKLTSEHDYNILTFSPFRDAPKWCDDGGSFGWNRDGLIYFCMEPGTYFYYNPEIQEMEKPQGEPVQHMIHKTFHGFGFHHANWNYKQLTLRDGRHGGFPDRGEGQYSQFSNYVLRALRELPKENFNEKCQWDDWFECEQERFQKDTCQLAYGSHCFDADNDGVVDLKDPYPFSSPVEGKDSTGDGIVDELDLCPWNEINVEGSKNPYDKLKLVVENIEQAALSFSSPNRINKIKIMDGERLPRGTTFEFINERTIESTTIQGQDLNPTDKNLRAPIWRVEVYYEYEEKDYYRPFFLYKAPFHEEFEYLYEKEWIYFSRFGCDIPTEIDLLDKDTYDQNRDGLPDQDKFSFAQKIDENYDWSDDGLPDIRDPLPTIKDGCKKTPEGYQCIRSPFKSNRTHHLHDHFRDPYEIEKKFFMPENSINSLDSVPINYTF